MPFLLKDNERSPFGLGWEYARRGKGEGDCPFLEGQEKEREVFLQGFGQFTPSPTADYGEAQGSEDPLGK